MNSEVAYMIFLFALAAAVQYYELVYKFGRTFGQPKNDTKPLAPIERVKLKAVLLIVTATTLTSCELIVPIGEQAHADLRTIKKGASGDGHNPWVIWRGNDLHLTIKFYNNCWYAIPKTDGYGKDIPINKVGGVGEWTLPFDFHRCNSARVGWVPDPSRDSIQVGTFVHYLQNTSHTYAFTVKTGDDFEVHIHNDIPAKWYRYTFRYKGREVHIDERMGDLGTGYLLGFYGGGPNYKAYNDMTALLRYTER